MHGRQGRYREIRGVFLDLEAVVAMVPELLHMAIMAGAMVAMWVAFNWAWAAYSQDMPACAS